jgi:hypothetical protein
MPSPFYNVIILKIHNVLKGAHDLFFYLIYAAECILYSGTSQM